MKSLRRCLWVLWSGSWEVDPLWCPSAGSEIRTNRANWVIRCNTRTVIQPRKNLRHCLSGKWLHDPLPAASTIRTELALERDLPCAGSGHRHLGKRINYYSSCPSSFIQVVWSLPNVNFSLGRFYLSALQPKLFQIVPTSRRKNA